MRIRLGLTFLATGTLLLAVVSACSDDDADGSPADPTSTATSSATDPMTSASATSPSDAATAAATALMETYYAVVDELGADPGSDLTRLESVATSTQLTAQRTFISRQHEQGRRQTGKTTIGTLTVQSVNLDNSDPNAGKVPTVVVDVCWDVSNVDVLDESGSSIVPPDRPDTGWTRYTVANYDYAADPTGGWRVATGQDLEQAPCAAS